MGGRSRDEATLVVVEEVVLTWRVYEATLVDVLMVVVVPRTDERSSIWTRIMTVIYCYYCKESNHTNYQCPF